MATFLMQSVLKRRMKKEWCALLFFIVACAPTPEPSIPEQVSIPVPEQTRIPVAAEEPIVESERIPEQEVQVVKKSEEPDECMAFGCPGFKVVADMEMDLFYECNCQRASWIKPENILCFETEAGAIERGYRKAQSC